MRGLNVSTDVVSIGELYRYMYAWDFVITLGVVRGLTLEKRRDARDRQTQMTQMGYTISAVTATRIDSPIWLARYYSRRYQYQHWSWIVLSQIVYIWDKTLSVLSLTNSKHWHNTIKSSQ